MDKDFFISTISDTLNHLYRQKLSIKLKNEMKFYDNEKYYIVRFNNEQKIVGISRIVLNLNEHYGNINKEVLPKLDLTRTIHYLGGVWVSKKKRGKGLSKYLLNARLKNLNKGDFIYTDMRISSPMSKYYEKIGMKPIHKNEKYIYYGGEYNGEFI